MNHRLVRHGTTDSTNERAFAALVAGEARHGDVHTAGAQTAGRGSRGREWRSAPGEGLCASLLWIPPAGSSEAPSPAALTMAVALAVHDVLAEPERGLGLARVRLKWPNDVLVGAEKIAGILIESRGLDPARPAFVCGIGVNVAQRAFPAGLRRPATSLALHGVAIEADALLELLLPHLDQRLDQGGEGIAADFARAANLAGRARVTLGTDELTGELVRFGLGGIELATAAGPRRLLLEHVTAVEASL